MTNTPQEPGGSQEWRDPNQPFGPPPPQHPQSQPQQPSPPGQESWQQPPPGPQGWQQQPGPQGWQQQPGQQGWQQQPGPQGWGGPGQQYGGQQYGYDPMARSRVAAGVLGILLGALGVHNFYTGYNQFAWIQLGSTLGSVVLTVITLGLFAPVSSVVIPGMAVWGLVEGIMFLTQRTGRYSMDASGRPLRD
ncbi:MAG: TM2 domain-containing protein [Actinobacteria bacterium]|nr:TM2 domain-containing protein [Actinomycetota bacterium]